MKCIKRNNEVARVTDSEAAEKEKNWMRRRLLNVLL
jgi:hypothetical protein